MKRLFLAVIAVLVLGAAPASAETNPFDYEEFPNLQPAQPSHSCSTESDLGEVYEWLFEADCAKQREFLLNFRSTACHNGSTEMQIAGSHISKQVCNELLRRFIPATEAKLLEIRRAGVRPGPEWHYIEINGEQEHLERREHRLESKAHGLRREEKELSQWEEELSEEEFGGSSSDWREIVAMFLVGIWVGGLVFGELAVGRARRFDESLESKLRTLHGVWFVSPLALVCIAFLINIVKDIVT